MYTSNTYSYSNSNRKSVHEFERKMLKKNKQGCIECLWSGEKKCCNYITNSKIRENKNT